MIFIKKSYTTYFFFFKESEVLYNFSVVKKKQRPMKSCERHVLVTKLTALYKLIEGDYADSRTDYTRLHRLQCIKKIQLPNSARIIRAGKCSVCFFICDIPLLELYRKFF